MTNLDALTDTALRRCNELATCSDEPGWLTRTFLSPSMKRAQQLLSEWMSESGLVVRMDAVGNVIGRKPGRNSTVLAVGSHFDTVPNAGKFDGVLGVLLGIAAAEAVSARSFKHSLDVLAFSEEEGVRFRKPYLGSRAVCGSFTPDLLNCVDADGIMMDHAIRDFGLNPDDIPSAAYPAGSLIGYFETHIEQGPVLDSLNAPVGVVSAIVGQSRYRLRFVGKAGHAGAQPMEMRHDALTAAAEMILFVEQTAKSTMGLRATVGAIAVAPGAYNVVPGEVHIGLDVRHASDQTGNEVVERLFARARSIGQARGLMVDFEPMLKESAVLCDVDLTARLTDTVSACGYPVHRLISGAGHDAVVMATRCPVAMLFLRSPGGISHHPDESVRREDVRAALEAMILFLEDELDQE